MKAFIKLFFLVLFIMISIYIVYIETERYESTSIVRLYDLSQKQQLDLSSAMLGEPSDDTQDSAIIELYIRSNEMYEYLDKKYHLSQYYTSETVDFIHRLYKDTPIPYYYAGKKNLLERYNSDLEVIYDETSGTISLAFAHADPVKSKQILDSIITHSDEVINKFFQENAILGLRFIIQQSKQNKASFVKAIKALIKFQNEHGTIDPNIDVERKTTILATLETDLVKSEVDYSSKLRTWNPNGTEMKMLKETIDNLKKSIRKIKKELAGATKLNELNTNVFEYELLKSEMDFSKQVYQQSLMTLEELKTEVSQTAKHLVVISSPRVADTYTYPDVIWDLFTTLVILLLLYFILMAILMIINDHKD
ncbi:hypothetical protein YH65_00915 [Sulfurovum lithotrophicum]|uniref:Capsule biosynthesis protein n=1 Tax=Sulfurovum lithotrophicum TaxID=206403 RepID=A0A7U4LZN7_9BACT|nr:hypothetical protein [Sulfurovum lithotrophicum]AKF24124.1 hypothetical protein YH65_00915 [Sulfurovum lithotrophicum]